MSDSVIYCVNTPNFLQLLVRICCFSLFYVTVGQIKQHTSRNLKFCYRNRCFQAIHVPICVYSYGVMEQVCVHYIKIRIDVTAAANNPAEIKL